MKAYFQSFTLLKAWFLADNNISKYLETHEE